MLTHYFSITWSCVAETFEGRREGDVVVEDRMEEIAIVSLERVSDGSVFPQNILTAVKKQSFTQTQIHSFVISLASDYIWEVA